MKATGIVRRIDELGRVVIPKEIRRTLRIREGDPLEIFTDRDGEVILKKYSPIGELSAFAREYTESLYRTLGHMSLICDKDQIVSCSGVSRKEMQDKSITPDPEQANPSRQTFLYNKGAGRACPILLGEEESGYTAQVITQILVSGESVGAVLLLSKEAEKRMGDTEIKVAETAAGFIGRQMET